MLCPNGTVKPFLVSLVEPVAYLKSELRAINGPHEFASHPRLHPFHQISFLFSARARGRAPDSVCFLCDSFELQ